MTDHTAKTETGPEMGSAGDDSFAWTEPGEAATTTDSKAREWLTQLQAMMENLATQAAPVVREVGAKAAELAAMAGEKAGPVAQRAAELTGQAGSKIAERGRTLAVELRRDAAATKADEGMADETVTSEATADDSTTAGVA